MKGKIEPLTLSPTNSTLPPAPPPTPASGIVRFFGQKTVEMKSNNQSGEELSDLELLFKNGLKTNTINSTANDSDFDWDEEENNSSCKL